MPHVRRLARLLGVRRRLVHITRYGHPLDPFDTAGWDPSPYEIR